MQRTSSQYYWVDYSRLYLLPHVSEAKVQKAVLEFLVADGTPVLAVDGGGKQVRGEGYRVLKAVGAKNAVTIVNEGRGLAGVIATVPGVYIQAKAPAWMRKDRLHTLRVVVRDAGERPPEQPAFMDRMASAAALVGVVWSVDDVIDLIEGAH